MEIKEISYSEQILNLYESLGWIAYTAQPDTLKSGFEHSLLTLGAFENDVLAGCVRVVGDGFTVVLIQDLLVHPEHQRKGIGTALIKEVLQRYHHVRQIQLVSDTTCETEAFYQALGFVSLDQIHCTGFMYMLKK